MANIKSAKKRIRVIEKKTARNVRIKNHIKEAEKAFLSAISAGDVETAEKAFKVVEKKLIQAVEKGTFHKNTASRTIGRFEAKLNAVKKGETVIIANEQAKKKAMKKNVEVDVAEESSADVTMTETVTDVETAETTAVEKPKVDTSMKKDELLDIAKKLDIEVSDKAKKADIIAAIEAK